MKTAETKTVSGASKSKAGAPFFSKKVEPAFFGERGVDQSSFFKPSVFNLVGNKTIQAKLTIGQSDDRYEREADAMADKVVQRLASPEPLTKKAASIQAKPLVGTITPLVQTKCAACEHEEKLQAKNENNNPGQTASASIESNLNASKGSGSPLPESTRTQMESSFGADFSSVRIHSDSAAAEMNKNLNAQAFTHGSDIYFNSGKYNVNGQQGKHLLAHELTHVVQQSGMEPNNTLQRYAHVDCAEDDLKKYVWPSDYVARQMVAKAIRVLGASPTDPSVTSLLTDYFHNSSPPIAEIISVFNKVNTAFTNNDYTYECETSCDNNWNAYTRKNMPWGRIHLCMESGIKGWTTECIARAIVHEFFHKYARLDDEMYCNTGCAAGDACSPCGSGLSTTDALDNADSFACFAYKLYFVSI
ncbi:MAG TPA: DUF4157 domain-containing protein [Chryseolinea sp.]